jgi:autotransporter-associated beta strand protein
MKNRRFSLSLLGSSLIVFTASAPAAEIVKDANTNALNLGTSWIGGTAPGSADVGLWNNTIVAGNVSPLSADVSWGGIKVSNVGGTQNNGSGTNSVQITTSGSQLTLGTSGIDLSAATQAMQIQSKILLGGNQNWVVANANTNGGTFGAAFSEDLYFAAQAQPTAMGFGGFTVSTSGAGSIVITNGYTVSNGILSVDNAGGLLVQSGSSRKTTLSADLTLNVAAGRNLVFKANSGTSGVAVDSAAPVNLTGATLKIESSNTTQINQTGKLTMAGTSTLDNTYGNSSANSRLLLSGGVEVTGISTWKESGSSATATIFNSNLTGSGTLNFQNTTTTRRADWSGDNSGFSGMVNLNGASGNRNLRLTTATAGSSTTIWAPAAGNTLEVDGVAVNLGTLNGAGAVTNSNATNVAAITVGSGTFSGVISNGIPTDGMALIKTGVGTLALTGANSYTGLTDIQGGTLTTTSAETGGGAVTVADSATFGVTQLNNGDTFNATTLTLGSTGGSTLELTPATSPSAALITAGTFDVNGSTTLRVKGLPVAGTTLVAYTTLGGTSGFSGLNLVMPFRINGTLGNAGSAITLATVQDETPKWRNGDGVWDINTSGNWKTSTTSTTTNYLEGGVGLTDSVIFDDTSSGTSPITVTLNSTVTPVAINVAGAKNYIISGSGTIAGTTGIIKNGSAALTLATANTFSGGVLLNEGALNVNSATALGSGTLSIAGGTVLNNTSGSPVVATNAQNWNGDFTFTGSNDLTLGAAAMTASTTVTVSAGTFSVGGIAGSGLDLTKEGPGTLALGGISSYSGATLVNNGVLKALAANGFSASSPVTLADTAGVALDLNGFNQTVTNLEGGGATGGNVILGGGVLTVNATGPVTFSGAISGAGGLIKSGSGTFTLAGDKTGYTGSTSVTAGTLDLDAINGYFGPTVTVTAGTADNSITVGGGLFVQGNGTLNTGISGGSAGFGARGGNLTVNVGGSGAMINRNSGGTLGLGQMIFGSADSDSKVIIQNEVGLNNNGGTRDITVNTGTGTASAEIAGPITPGTAGGKSGFVKKGAGELILSGTNTYTGDTKIDAGSVTLAATGQLTFVPTTNGTVNKITGVGSVALNGAISFNLAGANTTPGNVWKIVDDTPGTGLASNTIGGTFSVVGFAESSNVWTRTQGGSLWTFTESSRELSVQPAPGFAGWIAGTFANGTVPALQQGPNADPDGDGISNLVEYAIAGQDPTVPQGSVGTFAGGTLSFTKRALAVSNGDLVYAIEESDDLGISDPWAVVTPGVNDGTTISYTLPTAGSRLFARLKVTTTP